MLSTGKKTKQRRSIYKLSIRTSRSNRLHEIRKVIADLAQREMQKMTLIEATDYYVFDVIDPPAVMEEKQLLRERLYVSSVQFLVVWLELL